MTAHAGWAYRRRFRIRYSEVDAQGIVFNANFFSFFDQALTEYFHDIGYSMMDSANAGYDVHTVKALCEFKAPVHNDERIDVLIRPSHVGRSSMVFALELHGCADGDEAIDLRASGEIVWVWTNSQSKKSESLPAALAERLRRDGGLKDKNA